MIDIINTIANSIIIIFCVWTALDRRVHTKTLGSILLAIVGVCAALNIAQPEFGYFLPGHWSVVLNVALAVLAIWFWASWHDPRRRERRKAPR